MVLAGCGMCDDELYSAKRSPGGKWVLVVLVRDCGATTPAYTHISVGTATHSLELPEDLETICISKSEGKITADWVSENQIVVKAPSGSIETRETYLVDQKVTIIYDEQ